MTLEEFLTKKKIHCPSFKEALPQEYARMELYFAECGPKSFDHFMKFHFNEWRLRFPIPPTPSPTK
jgi:hypothetical protein